MAIRKFTSFEAIPADDETTYIWELYEGKLYPAGDVTIMRDGSSTVGNDMSGLTHFFDTREKALDYIIDRVSEEPVFVRLA